MGELFFFFFTSYAKEREEERKGYRGDHLTRREWRSPSTNERGVRDKGGQTTDTHIHTYRKQMKWKKLHTDTTDLLFLVHLIS